MEKKEIVGGRAEIGAETGERVRPELLALLTGCLLTVQWPRCHRCSAFPAIFSVETRVSFVDTGASVLMAAQRGIADPDFVSSACA